MKSIAEEERKNEIILREGVKTHFKVQNYGDDDIDADKTRTGDQEEDTGKKKREEERKKEEKFKKILDQKSIDDEMKKMSKKGVDIEKQKIRTNELAVLTILITSLKKIIRTCIARNSKEKCFLELDKQLFLQKKVSSVYFI